MKKKAILNWITAHEADMLDDIARLVAIDSTKGLPEAGCPFGRGPAEALKAAQLMASEYGFATESVDNYVCTVDMNDEKAGLDILAHLDVVPVNPEEWSVTEPFCLKLVDGKIYGRGTADDKGPAVAALYAMRAVKELGYKLNKNVRLILGSDEECGSSDIEYYYSKHKAAPYTISPDAEFPVVNVERGRYAAGYVKDFSMPQGRIASISCGSKDNVIPGEFRAELVNISEDEIKAMSDRAAVLGVSLDISDNVMLVKGVSGHAAEPEHAKNALTAALDIISLMKDESPLYKAILGLSKLFPFGDHYGEAAGVMLEDEVSGRLTMSLNRLDFTDGRLDCTFDSRVPEVANEDNVIEVMRSNGDKLGLCLKEARMSRPHIVREEGPFIQTLLACYEEVKGRKGYTMAIGGGTYVHEIENGVAFGPAEPDIVTNLHGFDENIPVKALVEAAVIYALVILRICGE